MKLICEVTNQTTVDTIAIMLDRLTGGGYKVVDNKVIKSENESTEVPANTNDYAAFSNVA